MKNSNFQSFIIDILTVSVILLYLLISSLKLPFSLIDDGQFASKAAAVETNWKAFFTAFPGVHEGRFAPVFWAYFVSKFIILGNNAMAHHVIHVVVAWISLIILYILVRKESRSRLAAILTCLFFLFLAPGFESWFRISTQEPMQVLFLLLFWLSISKRKISLVLSGFLGLLLLLTKETSVILLIPLLVPAFWETKLRKISLLMAGIAGSVGAIIYYVVQNAGWSAENSGFAYFFPSLLEYSKMFTSLYLWPLVGMGLILMLSGKRVKIGWQGLGLAFVVLLSLCMWKYPLLRLLMTFKLGLSIFLGYRAAIIWENRKLRWLIPLYAIFMIKIWYVNFLEIDNFSQHYLAREVNNGKLLREIASLPRDTSVVMNISKDDAGANEWIVRMPEYLDVFYGRKDIRIGFWEAGVGNYLASWSYYSLHPEDNFQNLVFETQETARPLSVSLKNWIVRPDTARGEKRYSWKLFQLGNPPSKVF